MDALNGLIDALIWSARDLGVADHTSMAQDTADEKAEVETAKAALLQAIQAQIEQAKGA